MQFPEIWLGSEDAYMQAVYRRLFYMDNRASYANEERMLALRETDEDDEEFSLSQYLAARLIEKQGSVGIVTIDGALTRDESFYNLWFGDVAYSTIATAVNQLLSDTAVQSIVLSWASPGGDAAGIEDLGTFLKEAGKIKPIHSWVGQAALSAAYWAAASCKSVRASELGETGSVGAIMQFTSVARRLQEQGVDVHIERAGKYKALLQPSEALTEAGRAYMRDKVEYLHEFFIKHIEQARPSLRDVSRSKWAEGQTFYAREAIEMGLVDGPALSLSAFVGKLQAQAARSESQRGVTMAKSVLLDQQALAALASGAIPGAAGGALPGMDNLPGGGVPGGEGGAGSSDLLGDRPTGQESASASAAASELVLSACLDGGLEGYLKDKVETLEVKLAELQVQLTRSEDQLRQLQDVETVLAPIAVEATQRLQVALGQAPLNLLGLPARTLAETYSAALADFNQRFKPGRASVPALETDRTGQRQPSQPGQDQDQPSLAERRLMRLVQE